MYTSGGTPEGNKVALRQDRFEYGTPPIKDFFCWENFTFLYLVEMKRETYKRQNCSNTGRIVGIT